MAKAQRIKAREIVTRGGVKIYQGTFGASEMLQLRIWAPARASKRGLEEQRNFSVVGCWDMYCGNGGMHREAVEIEGALWLGAEAHQGDLEVLVMAAYQSDTDAAEEALELGAVRHGQLARPLRGRGG